MSVTDRLRDFFGRTEDKAKHRIDKVEGQAKEAVGKLRGDRSRENEGRFDQAKADAKQAGEKVGDALRR